MCGIVGYIGRKDAAAILMNGLDKLSYRGYDSAGIAVIDDRKQIHVRKAKGRLENLTELLEQSPVEGCMGIGHTRWATHGEPSDRNAHPHTDVQGGIAVVHNGIIENHESLRRYLTAQGAVFVSQTDTEVIAHLLKHFYHGNLKETLLKVLPMLEGSYALGVICDQEPDALYCARNDSPLVIGVGERESYIASDIPALLPYTREVIFLSDKEIARLDGNGITVFDAYGETVHRDLFHVDWDMDSAEKGGYAHYMLKEIHEQPEALEKTLASRRPRSTGDCSWLPVSREEARRLKRIIIAGCGTACHAGMIGRYVIEQLARVPVDVEIASEYRYRDPVIGPEELFIAISQSGETADTLAAVREAKRRGARVIAICNVVGSTLAREAGERGTLYTYAGPEIAVASTKAYITQVEMMLLLAIALGQLRGTLADKRAEELYRGLEALPDLAALVLKVEQPLQRFASVVSQKKHVFFVGRGLDYALSMEAALKLKEISYIFSEAYAAGELKHGPIALLKPGRLVVATVTQSALLEKTLSNLQEVTARGAAVLAICSESLANRVRSIAAEIITIPDADDLLTPLLAVIPLQLFAYCMAVARGCDVDKPRNLAKSVTVE